ncbi:hypothetical protein TcYC6_0000700 [Trypanosoma cruzi]|nr:hypothetical protein TcYC6_0000700 [Trypanosoma cruzi]
MLIPTRHALRRLGASPSFITARSVRSTASLCRHARWNGCARVLASAALGDGNTIMYGSRRSLFKNQKGFSVGRESQLHADDVALAERNRKLFGGATAHGEGSAETRADDDGMPTAFELDRILPSAKQLQDEIPSVAEVRDAMKEGGDAAMWKKTEEDDYE